MENTVNEFYDNRNLQNDNEGDNLSNKKLTEMTREEKSKWFRQFLAEKNKNKRKPTQEEVTAEFESLRGKYYVDKNGNFRFIDGSDE